MGQQQDLEGAPFFRPSHLSNVRYVHRVVAVHYGKKFYVQLCFQKSFFISPWKEREIEERKCLLCCVFVPKSLFFARRRVVVVSVGVVLFFFFADNEEIAFRKGRERESVCMCVL